MASLLVIDDKEDILNLVKFILELKKHTVDITTSGMQGLQMLKNKHYDLLLLDLMMPEITGYELIKIIRKDPELKNQKVTTMTASINPEEVKNIKKLGFDYLITKPFTAQELAEEVKKQLTE